MGIRGFLLRSHAAARVLGRDCLCADNQPDASVPNYAPREALRL